MEPFKIRMSSEDDIKAGVRSAELEADWECSFSVFIHFSQTQEPRVAAVFLLLQTWPPIHNGSDSNLWTQLEERSTMMVMVTCMCRVTSSNVIIRAGFLCCIVSWGQACLLAPVAGAWSTKAVSETRQIILSQPHFSLDQAEKIKYFNVCRCVNNLKSFYLIHCTCHC